jgi:hypothetical protein
MVAQPASSVPVDTGASNAIWAEASEEEKLNDAVRGDISNVTLSHTKKSAIILYH